MNSKTIGKVCIWFALVIALIGGALVSANEKQTAQTKFAEEMAKSHSASAVSICSKLISTALNIEAYKTDYAKCISVVESNSAEMSKSSCRRQTKWDVLTCPKGTEGQQLKTILRDEKCQVTETIDSSQCLSPQKK